MGSGQDPGCAREEAPTPAAADSPQGVSDPAAAGSGQGAGAGAGLRPGVDAEPAGSGQGPGCARGEVPAPGAADSGQDSGCLREGVSDPAAAGSGHGAGDGIRAGVGAGRGTGWRSGVRRASCAPVWSRNTGPVSSAGAAGRLVPGTQFRPFQNLTYPGMDGSG
ncbi:hypothetical protein ACFRJ1_28330 [Streptomyces sp. NPDC056773]|uniref:hypothetical protein n=1 Tax=unclassified Streptomyces TaxID=2593676 RepID=UPI0036A7A4A6